jgi:cytochrome c biogenesis protein CcmG, thiol:disulfide interchange protein DsbE
MSRTPRAQWIAVGVIVLLLTGALTAGLLLSEDVSRVEVGAQAPDFTAVNLATGDTVTLSNYRGQVILLNLWATWCAPCRVEMPSMQRLANQLEPEGLKVVAVSVDVISSRNVTAFADELGLKFDILQDPTRRIETTYQTTGLPETFLINKHGEIVHWHIGPEEWDSPAQVSRIRMLLQESSGGG